MDPYISQWSQSAEAQPYMQKAITAMGGSGMGGQDQYGQYLQELINSNQANPTFQKQMLGYYLDYTNPQNQQQTGVDENKLNTALSLWSSENEEDKMIAKLLLSEVYPQISDTMSSGYGAPNSYEDILRNEAMGLLKEPESLSRDDYEWQKFMANATDEQVRQYEEAKGKWANPFDEYWKGTGVGNPFDSSFWSPEARARAKMGYN